MDFKPLELVLWDRKKFKNFEYHTRYTSFTHLSQVEPFTLFKSFRSHIRACRLKALYILLPVVILDHSVKTLKGEKNQKSIYLTLSIVLNSKDFLI